MLLDVGVIGLGNCGSQVAALAAAMKQFPALGVNTSERDIDAVKSVNGFSVIFMDGAGAGKDISIARNILKTHINSFLVDEKFTSFAEQCEVIFVVSSTGGGTGCGINPLLCHILKAQYDGRDEKHPKKIIIPVGILPTMGESIGAMRNTVSFLKGITDLDLSYMLFDNNQVGNDVPTSEIMNKVNGAVVDAMCVIRGDYNQLSPFGMIDTQDMRKLIELPGLMFINHLSGIYQEKIPSDGTIEDLIIENINKNNLMVNPDRNKLVERRGYIVNLSKDIQEYFNKDFPEITKLYGEPIEVFDHYSINEDEDERNNYAILIMSGMTLPNNRIKVVQNRIDAAEKLLAEKKQNNDILKGLSDQLSAYDGTMAKNKQEKQSESLEDILNMY